MVEDPTHRGRGEWPSRGDTNEAAASAGQLNGEEGRAFPRIFVRILTKSTVTGGIRAIHSMRNGGKVMPNRLLGKRVGLRREELGLERDELSSRMGFDDPRILSDIEFGTRPVSGEELLRFSQVLGAPLEYFADACRLAGEGAFSWRQSGVTRENLDGYEYRVGRFIALHRALGQQLDLETTTARPKIHLTKASRYEDATAAGERFALDYELGDIPSHRLADVMEKDLGILVLMVDPVKGVSGAACHLPELDTVLINRREVPGRRHYNLAHELFHILTWDKMPPERIEETGGQARDRVERLADNFASGLLMPRFVLDRFGDWEANDDSALAGRLNAVAEEIGVTASALRWRLVATGALPEDVAKGIDPKLLRNNGRNSPSRDEIPLFSHAFMERISLGVDAGRISIKKVVDVTGIYLDDLESVYAAHEIDFVLGI